MSSGSLDKAGAGSSEPVPAVVFRNITKTFGAVTACDGVDLAIQRGRIHGILGENGAGKSTLMKMLIGLVLPDQGSIEVDGTVRQIRSPQAAASIGIGMVHLDCQTLKFCVATGHGYGSFGNIDSRDIGAGAGKAAG